MYSGLLPIGSVVLLKNSTKRLMIIGVCQRDTDGKAWDYCGCYYPEGIRDKSFFAFDGTQIEKYSFIGYQDREQFAFKSKMDSAWSQLKEQNNNSINE